MYIYTKFLIKTKFMRKIWLLISVSIVALIIVLLSVDRLSKERDKSINDLDRVIEHNNLLSKEKQKQIDSILSELKNSQVKINYFESKIDKIQSENKDLRIELDKKKSQIDKMNSNEILNYWKNEFKN